MKTLLLIRHAKSDQAASGRDFDRPLNNRGKKDAPAMARRLKEKEIIPDLLIASPAKRARDTARGMATVWNYEEKNIRLEKDLYEATPPAYYEIIRAAPDQYNYVAIVGHNPTVGLLADSLSTFPVDRFPTCCIAAFKIYTDTWKNFQQAEKEFLFLDFPGNLRR